MPADDTPIVLSTTAFNDAAFCLKKYEYRHVDKLIPRPRDVSPKMRRGTWIHRALQLHDLGLPWIEELERMYEWARNHDVPEPTELFDNCRWLVEDYIAFWQGHDKKEGGPFTTLATEEKVEFTPVPGRTITATIDRIVKDARGRVWIWERKTTEDIPDSDWRGVDPQTLIQLYAAVQNKWGTSGVIFDYVRTDPGPRIQVYKPNKQGRGGRVYDSVLGKAVTSRAFEAAIPEITTNWQPGSDYAYGEDYAQAMRMRLVQDEAWFIRYPVLRPDDMVLQTMKDIASAMRHISRARETNHYARSYHPLTCRLFCPYGKLCMHEYRLGRPSAAMREELFVIETPELRAEGRSEDAPYSRPA